MALEELERPKARGRQGERTDLELAVPGNSSSKQRDDSGYTRTIVAGAFPDPSQRERSGL